MPLACSPALVSGKTAAEEAGAVALSPQEKAQGGVGGEAMQDVVYSMRTVVHDQGTGMSSETNEVRRCIVNLSSGLLVYG